MLIQFSVKNYRSIKDQVNLDLQINPFIKEFPENIIPSNFKHVKDLQRCIVIYGVNGTGKSNLLFALDFMRNFILKSHHKTVGDNIEIEPFLLDEASHEDPSTFSIEFIFNNVRYEYSFSVTKVRVTSESLIAYPKKAKQTWFSREYDPASNEYKWNFGSQFKGEKDGIRKRTLENTLFFSKAAQDNHELIRPLIEYFSTQLEIIFGSGDGEASKLLLQSPRGKAQVLKLLKAADLGIDDIFVESREIPTDQLPDFFPEDIIKQIRKDSRIRLKTKSVHKIPNSEDEVIFDFQTQESYGANKIFNLAAAILSTLEKGGALFIDEIENNLHGKLIAFIIKLFQETKTNTTSAQLIFTTHNSSILDAIDFRRDQLYFAAKNDEKSTVLYNLSRIAKFKKSFKQVRKGQSLLIGYLEGKYFTPPNTNEQLTFDELIEQNED